MSGSLVIDANVFIAIALKEALRDAKASQELTSYSSQGYIWYAPGVAISETLYVLRSKVSANSLTPKGYVAAVALFETAMRTVSPPPMGDKALIHRASEISDQYGPSRSADSIYIALAELLAQNNPTVLLTFDQDLPKQAAKNAPSVQVQLL